ncbi:unnamed protein product [Phytophthora fragariaefolia]|uniref:Unnamed protein product n=1 Tax=Phytophthora fragariaefolia TaxID=1490495 RepID=A0A9W7CRN6_9STRA|nr:unnamed protein product [Phytophthora fragariaefolia]
MVKTQSPPSNWYRACVREISHRFLGLRCLSSTLADQAASSTDRLDGVKNVKKETQVRGKTVLREKEVLAALRTYKELNGHLLVPRPFTVPDDERWPSDLWGYRLGSVVSYLRNVLEKKVPLPAGMEEELKHLDFVRNVSKYKWDNIVLPGLRRFYQEHGHTDIPQQFVVPDGDESWPRLAWGYRLGSIVIAIRHEIVYLAQVATSKDDLDRMDFCYDMTLADRDWEEKVLPSIQVYHKEFGHCIIPIAFAVPSRPPWPEKAWGISLGTIAKSIRARKTYAENAARDKDVLDAVGFVWNHHDTMWNEVIIPALETFVNVYKNDKVPQSFVVPSESPWPKIAWGRKLGVVISDIRNKGIYFAHFGRDIDKLLALGLHLKLSARAWEKRVAPLLKTYAELHDVAEISDDFVVPSEAPWEESMWGVRLGLIVAYNS